MSEKTVDDLRIDPKALYTVDQAAKMLVELDPTLSFEAAKLQISEAVANGKLRLAGYMRP